MHVNGGRGGGRGSRGRGGGGGRRGGGGVADMGGGAAEVGGRGGRQHPNNYGWGREGETEIFMYFSIHRFIHNCIDFPQWVVKNGNCTTAYNILNFTNCN